MDAGIGVTLREARNRRKVDLAEVEAAIKIRPRYLSAIENEEWDALPGGAYTRAFIRSYANYLGLDGERLADEYRRATAPPGGERAPRRVEPVPSGSRRRRAPRVPAAVLAVAVSAGLVALLIGIGLAGGGDDGDEAPAPQPAAERDGEAAGESRPAPVAQSPGVAVRLVASAEVWVCMLDADGEELIAGQILAAGAEEGPFRGEGFTLALGNGEVELSIDGERAPTPPSSSPVGYEIGPDGELAPLEEGERPDCA